MYRLSTLALFLLLGTKAAFSQENKQSELFKGANLIVLETTDAPSTLKEAGKFLVSKGYRIEKYDTEFGQIVTSSKECPKPKNFQCRYVLSSNTNSLEWKTEAKASMELYVGTIKQNAEWFVTQYKGPLKAVLEQAKGDASSFATSAKLGAVWVTVRD